LDPTEELVKQQMAGVKCSVCGSLYESERVEILGRQEELWFLTITCAGCGTQGLVAAMVRDASPEEAAQARALSTTARQSEPNLDPPFPSTVSDADILELRRFLEDFDGDFQRMFAKKELDGREEA
jgi:hypothetical protein